MRPIVAFDPGVSTGFAVVTPEGVVQILKTYDVQSMLDQQFRDLMPLDFYGVVELFPIPSLTPANIQILQVFASILAATPGAALITPGEWKTSRVAQTIDIDWARTTHEKDAALLGLYYWNKLKEAR